MRPDLRVVFSAPGEVRIETPAAPEPGPGEVLLETRRSLISTGTELAHLLGPPWRNPGGRTLPVYPHATGYSNAARVLAVGEAVTSWKPGDRVASGARHAAFPTLRERDWAVRVPDAVSDEEATFCTLATTVLNGCRIGEPQLGEDAVVVGMGLLGQILVQYLRLAGCERVIAVDVADARLEIAGSVGAATHHLNPSRDDVAIVASHPAEDERRHRWSRRANGELVMRWLADKRLDVRPLITDRIPAAEAARAYHLLAEERERHLGIILEWP
jgi:threonine dehydrogenase-like Zn-dependent dehydrogenase